MSHHFVVILGPPGGGKGTQAKLLAEALGVPHISSGDLFREHLGRATEFGRLAKEYMDRGDLVPDGATVGMVVERISRPDCQNGVILDGFPRTLSQVVPVDQTLGERGRGVTVAALIQVSDAEVTKRLTSRRTCGSCGAVYNLLFNPPRVAGVCDVCEGELYLRDDDNPETVRNRLFIYYKETAPLVGYYFAKGLLRKVNGEQSIEAVQADLIEAVLASGS